MLFFVKKREHPFGGKAANNNNKTHYTITHEHMKYDKGMRRGSIKSSRWNGVMIQCSKNHWLFLFFKKGSGSEGEGSWGSETSLCVWGKCKQFNILQRGKQINPDVNSHSESGKSRWSSPVRGTQRSSSLLLLFLSNKSLLMISQYHEIKKQGKKTLKHFNSL